MQKWNEGKNIGKPSSANPLGKHLEETVSLTQKVPHTVDNTDSKNIPVVPSLFNASGVAKDLVKLIGNACFRHSGNQDLVRTLGVCALCAPSIFFNVF